ncbi:hypothetical protein X948_3003 [Burkholderia pseudomallei MSHR5608]|nr:hypothetical protein X948_3003 [Burkholderia pseudomallei MSHR5608]
MISQPQGVGFAGNRQYAQKIFGCPELGFDPCIRGADIIFINGHRAKKVIDVSVDQCCFVRNLQRPIHIRAGLHSTAFRVRQNQRPIKRTTFLRIVLPV